MPTRFAHTNPIAHDPERLMRFYCDVFGCSVVPPERDLRGPWLEAATGVANAHLLHQGEEAIVNPRSTR